MVECVKALALCHNVTPVMEEGEGEGEEEETVIFQREDEEKAIYQGRRSIPERNISYQASSPDEVCRKLSLISIQLE